MNGEYELRCHFAKANKLFSNLTLIIAELRTRQQLKSYSEHDERRVWFANDEYYNRQVTTAQSAALQCGSVDDKATRGGGSLFAAWMPHTKFALSSPRAPLQFNSRFSLIIAFVTQYNEFCITAG